MPVQFRQLTRCECRQLARFLGRSAGRDGGLAARVADGGPVWRARLENRRELAGLVTRWSAPDGQAAEGRPRARLRVDQVTAALRGAEDHGLQRDRALIRQLIADWERVPKTIVLTPAAGGWAISDGNRTAVAAHEFYRNRGEMALGVLILAGLEATAP